MAAQILAVLVLILTVSSSAFGQTTAPTVKKIDEKGKCEIKVADTPDPTQPTGIPGTVVLRAWSQWEVLADHVSADECLSQALNSRRTKAGYQDTDKFKYRFKVGRKTIIKGAFYNR